MNAIDRLQDIFDQITKGLVGTNDEKILQLRENLDILPIDLGSMSKMVTFDETTNLLKVKGYTGKTKQVVMFHLNEFPSVLERTKAISVRRWKTLNKRSDQLQKDYLEIQNRLMLDGAETIETELFREDAQELMALSKLPKNELLRGYALKTIDKIYLLQHVISQ